METLRDLFLARNNITTCCLCTDPTLPDSARCRLLNGWWWTGGSGGCEGWI